MDTRWLVVVAAASACVPVPPFRGDDAQQQLLWFRDGLAGGEHITIDPR